MSQFWKIKQRSSHLGGREEIHRLTQDWWWCWWVNALLAHASGSQHHWPILQLRAVTANDWSDVKIHMEWKNIVECSQSFITWPWLHTLIPQFRLYFIFLAMKICSRISMYTVADLTWSISSNLRPDLVSNFEESMFPDTLIATCSHELCKCTACLFIFLCVFFLTVSDKVRNIAHLKWLRAVSSACISSVWSSPLFWLLMQVLWHLFVTTLSSCQSNKLPNRTSRPHPSCSLLSLFTVQLQWCNMWENTQHPLYHNIITFQYKIVSIFLHYLLYFFHAVLLSL